MWQRPLKYTVALLKLRLVALVLNACIGRDNNYSELIVIARCLTCHIELSSLSIP